MENIKFNSTLNMKELPAKLTVNGTITTYRVDDKIKIVKAYQQGINPQILILELKFSEGKGPMKGTDKSFSYENHEVDVKNYQQVTLLYGENQSITDEIQFLG